MKQLLISKHGESPVLVDLAPTLAQAVASFPRATAHFADCAMTAGVSTMPGSKTSPTPFTAF